MSDDFGDVSDVIEVLSALPTTVILAQRPPTMLVIRFLFVAIWVGLHLLLNFEVNSYYLFSG